MNKVYNILSVLLIALVSSTASAQAFKKGSLTLSVSEGVTISNYTTTNIVHSSDVYTTAHMQGNRDPLFVEYGITGRWGVGLSIGTDIYKIDPGHLYNYGSTDGNVNAFMGEISADVNYHFFVTKRLDVAAFTALGLAGVNFTARTGDEIYDYKCGGTIVRAGIKAKYYVLKRIGVMGILSGFSANCTTSDTPKDYWGDPHPYATSIRGVALEFGLCYRILR